MSDLARDALRAIEKRFWKAAVELFDGTISAAWFQMEADLLIQAYQVLDAAAAKKN